MISGCRAAAEEAAITLRRGAAGPEEGRCLADLSELVSGPVVLKQVTVVRYFLLKVTPIGATGTIYSPSGVVCIGRIRALIALRFNGVTTLLNVLRVDKPRRGSGLAGVDALR